MHRRFLNWFTVAVLLGIGSGGFVGGLNAIRAPLSCEGETCEFQGDSCVPGDDRECHAGCWVVIAPDEKKCEPGALNPDGTCMEPAEGHCCGSGECTGPD